MTVSEDNTPTAGLPGKKGTVMKNDTVKLELKAFKLASFASEETLCFEGKVYMDGSPVATVHNEGHGGPTSLDPLPKSKDRFDKLIKRFGRRFRELVEIDHAKWREEVLGESGEPKLPDYDGLTDQAEHYNGVGALESLLDDIAGNIEEDRIIKRWHKKGVVYRLGASPRLETVGYKFAIDKRPDSASLRDGCRQQILAKHPDAKIIEPDPAANCIEVTLA